MGDIFYTVREVSTRFIDPITKQLAYSLIKRFGLTDYFDNALYIFNGRTNVSKSDDKQDNMRVGNNRIDIDVETHLNPSVQMWDRLVDFNSPSYGTSKMWTDRYEKIWADDAVGVNLTEYTVPFGLTLNVRMTFKSFDAAQMALDRITTQTQGDVVNQVHDIVYTYPIDLSLIGILGRVYNARASLNSQLTFYQYVQKFMRAQMNVEVNRYDVGAANPATEYVIKKYQLNCLAMLQCDNEVPEAIQQDDVADAWVVSFTYKFQSGRPQNLKLTIPPIVEQTLMPNVLFAKNDISWYDKIAGAFQNKTFREAFLQFRDIRSETRVVLRLPKYDDFNPPSGGILDRYGYNTLFIGIVPADSSGTASASFTNMGGITLHPIVLEILGMHTQDDLFGMSGLFNITVYVNDIPLDSSIVSFDTDTLTLTFTADRPQGIYRVVLSEAGLIRTLNPKWLDVILKYRYFFPMTVFRNLDYLSKMGRYTVTSDNSLINLIMRLNASDKLGYYIDKMISLGYATGEAYEYTQTATQFSDYITSTRARVDENNATPQQYYGSDLFTVLMDLLQADGIITAQTRPTEYVATPKGWPYGAGRGGWLSFNVPLRVQYTKLITGK